MVVVVVVVAAAVVACVCMNCRLNGKKKNNVEKFDLFSNEACNVYPAIKFSITQVKAR